MKKALSFLLCLSLLLSLPALAVEPDGEEVTTEAAPPAFSDIENHWGREIIEKYAAMGVINGYPDGTFRPDDLVTRAEAAKILTLTFELERPETVTDYIDLKGTEWHYSDDICAAPYLSMNVVPDDWETNAELLRPYWEADQIIFRPDENGPNALRGYKENHFLPKAHIARYQLADTVVELLIQRDEINTAIDGYSYALVKETFPNEEHPYLGRLTAEGIRMYDRIWLAYKQGIMEGDAGCFRAYNAVTRTELLTVIDRVLEREENPLEAVPAAVSNAVDPPAIEWYSGFPAEMYYDIQIIENESYYAYLGVMGGLPDAASNYYISVVYKNGETPQWQYSDGRKIVNGNILKAPRYARIAFDDEPNILIAYGAGGGMLLKVNLETQEVLWKYAVAEDNIMMEDWKLWLERGMDPNA